MIGQGIGAQRIARLAADILLQFGAADFQQGGFGAQRQRGIVDHPHDAEFQRLHPDSKAGNGHGERKMRQERRAVTCFTRGDMAETMQQRLGPPDIGIQDPFMPDGRFQKRPAFAFLPDPLCHGDADIFKKHLIENMQTVEGGQGLHRNTRAFHIDQQDGNALLPRPVTAGADQQFAPVGPLRMGGPDFTASDNIIIAVPDSPASQRRQVGPGLRLGKALAPDFLPLQDRRQIARLLFLGGIGDQQRRNGNQPHRNKLGRMTPRAFFLKNILLRLRPAGTAICLRPARRGPASGIEAFVPGQ